LAAHRNKRRGGLYSPIIVMHFFSENVRTIHSKARLKH